MSIISELDRVNLRADRIEKVLRTALASSGADASAELQQQLNQLLGPHQRGDQLPWLSQVGQTIREELEQS
jgi:hypothetical protein